MFISVHCSSFLLGDVIFLILGLSSTKFKCEKDFLLSLPAVLWCRSKVDQDKAILPLRRIHEGLKLVAEAVSFAPLAPRVREELKTDLQSSEQEEL